MSLGQCQLLSHSKVSDDSLTLIADHHHAQIMADLFNLPADTPI
jgi:hypothetical protein